MTNVDAIHIKMLEAELQIRLERNSSYSLRAFARDLGVSAATLSLLMNKKKGISKTLALAIAKKIGWNIRESTLFCKSIVVQHSNKPMEKLEAQKKLELEYRKTTISDKTLAAIHQWYGFALLELMEFADCEHTPEWFAVKLNLNVAMVKKTLKGMLEAGLVEYKDLRYLPCVERTTTDFDKPSSEIKSFHSQLLKHAEKALYLQEPAIREFLGMTLAFPKEEIAQAKEMIRGFQEVFAERFYHATPEKRNSVYQLNVQLFRVDSSTEGKV